MNKLLENIASLFKKYGIKSMTMDDIADNLGISKKTLYQRFGNKENMIYQIMLLEIEKEQREINAIIKLKSPSTQLNDLCNYILSKHNYQNPLLFYNLNKQYPNISLEFNKKRDLVILNYIQSILKDGVKNNFFKKDLEIENFSSCLTYLLIKEQNILHTQNYLNIFIKYTIDGISNVNS